MDTTNHHTITSLFDQLGLDSDPKAIDRFIEEHHLKPDERIQDADFWSSAQKAFISEALTEDSDWTEIVDILDAELHHNRDLNAFHS